MNDPINTENTPTPRILVVDDNPSIHEDFRKILCPTVTDHAVSIASLTQDVFGDRNTSGARCQFEMDSAFQGQQALEKVCAADAEGRPFSLAFVDVRMPPGWDGVETIRHIWQEHPHIQVVICTAYSDYSWDQILSTLGETDSLVILKKPFDNVEVLQLAHTLTKKWLMARAAHARMVNLDDTVKKRTFELLEANHQLETEIKRRSHVETQLRESEERFRKAFTSVSVPLVIAEATTNAVVEINQSFLQLCGFTEAEVVGKALDDLDILGNPEEFLRIVEKTTRGESVREAVLTLRRKDGNIRHTLASVEKITIGKIPSLLASLQDMTEKRHLEEQLRQFQKMEAIGQLAAGVAHDFNNLLTIIHGYTGLQLAKDNLDADIANAFRQVKAASDRAAALTRQLLAFSRQQIVQCKPCNLHDAMGRMKAMLPQALGETVTLECQIPNDLPCVFADESNLDQVIMNLAVNARDAMPAGGILTLSAREAVIRAEEAAKHPDKHEGNYVDIIVSDTGCGMDKNTLNRIFEPFFTTKPIGRGTGLGLSTVFGIVKQHKGWTEVQSEPGIGTTFHIFLPMAEKTNRPSEKLETAGLKSAIRVEGGEGVLVVEDEKEVREFIVKVLNQEGFEVVQAGSGAEALAKWGRIADGIRLLVTDIILPQGISGTALAKHLLRRKPDLQVLYISGYRPETAEMGTSITEGINFLPKPFTSEQLMTLIHRARTEFEQEKAIC